jgi:hypothetical protein
MIRAQVFKLYKNNLTDGNEDSDANGKNSISFIHSGSTKYTYSLYEMCKMDLEELDQMIFILDHYIGKDENELDNQNMLKKSVEIQKDENGKIIEQKAQIFSRYVQVKR